MARPKKKAEDKAVRQSVSMDPVQLRQVVAYCQKNERTIAWLIKKAVAAFLEAEVWQEEDQRKKQVRSM